MRTAEQIADDLERARADHKNEFPAGDWREVNERLGRLRMEAWPFLGYAIGIGNERAIEILRAQG